MNDHVRDPLDQAIDRVAARLVSVEQDDALAERIVARLPERPARAGWLGVLVPQAAVATVLVVAAFLWTTRDRPSTREHDRSLATSDEAREPIAVAGIEPETPRTAAPPPVAAAEIAKPWIVPPKPAENLSLRPDHERGLTPVAAPIPIELAGLEAPSISEEAPLVVAPLVLTELPLSGESISPQM